MYTHLTQQTVHQLSTNEPQWLINLRNNAFQQFLDVPMPTFRYGTDIQLDPTRCLDLNIINPLQNQPLIVEKNNDALIETFQEAFLHHPELMQQHFMKYVQPTDKLSALHYAFFSSGIVIHVPQKVKTSYTLHIPHTTATMIYHILIILEPNSSLHIVHESVSTHTEPGYVSEVVEVIAKENAQLSFGSVQMLNNQTFHTVIRRALLEKDARVEWLDVSLGSSFTKSEVSSVLNGPGATTYNYGLFYGKEKQQFDILAAARHNASHTVCDMFTKGALADASRLVYRGLIHIEENASGCNGYQKEETLLLSEHAVADSIPELEINNNDVRCTHGATIGQIDKEKLFYMQSRGIPEKIAEQTIVEGFFEPLVQRLSSKTIQEKVRETILSQIRANG